MLPEEETLLLKAAQAARKAYLPEMDNWDDLKPSAVKGWVDVARAVRDSIDESYSRASGATELFIQDPVPDLKVTFNG